jgi:uncharacterized protein YndB with AHSA1/START domain
MMPDTTHITIAPDEPTIVITREFDAPRRLVFAAWTTPEHVWRWYGPSYLTFTVCEIDLRPGGRWRYVLRAPDGGEHGFGGEYREIEPPERLVYTEGYEAMPGHEYLVTLTFDEHEGRTMLTSTGVYQSFADRDGHVASGMEDGMRETLDRLAEHLDAMEGAN